MTTPGITASVLSVDCQFRRSQLDRSTRVHRNCCWLALVSLLLAVSVGGASADTNRCRVDLGLDTPDVSPIRVASVWLIRFKTMARAIPTPSPREEQWIEQEKASGNWERMLRVLNSEEYVRQQASRNVTGLVIETERITARAEDREVARAFLRIQVYLLEPDSGHSLAELLRRKIIAIDALPMNWTFLASKGDRLTQEIADGRSRLASGISECIIAPLLGVEMWGKP